MPVENLESSKLRVRRINEAVDRLKSQWTYHDVLWLGIAGLPAGVNELTADSASWQETVARAKDQLVETDPVLLSRVHFDRRPGGPPYSDEVQSFTFFLVLDFWTGPQRNTFIIPEAVKMARREPRQAKLAEYTEGIDVISRELLTLAV